MERTVERQLEETCRVPGIYGAICVDRNGLLLAHKGQVPKLVSGPVSTLAQLASTLHTKCYNDPVIVVESQRGKTLIKQENGITTAVYRT